MRAVFGLVELDRGRVRWQGEPIGVAERTRFGYMPEERGLYPRMRVREQLVYLGQLCGRASTDVGRTVDTWLERLGLSDRATSRLDTLSHGNQQRVQLIAALVNEPDLLVLDEPFSGLDPIAMGTHGRAARGGRGGRARRCCSPATSSISSRTCARTSSSSTTVGSCWPASSTSCGPRSRSASSTSTTAGAASDWSRAGLGRARRVEGRRGPSAGRPRRRPRGGGRRSLGVPTDILSFAYQPPTLSELFREAVAA